jgi:hypothetical protein
MGDCPWFSVPGFQDWLLRPVSLLLEGVFIMASQKVFRLLLSAILLISGCEKKNIIEKENPKSMSCGYDKNIEINASMDDLSTTVIYAEVDNVISLPRPSDSTKLWAVQLTVKKVINAGQANIINEDKVVIFVHSVIKTFFVDVENIRGKTFKIVYLQPFNTRYEGEVEVSEEESQGQSPISSSIIRDCQ